MRTKTLLAAAILAAGIASSVAQSNVYSLNVVGYVNQTYNPGFQIIANPLNATNNTIANILPNAPFFSTVYKFVGGTYLPANSYFGAWSDPSMTLAPGEGAWLFIPAGPSYTNTYVGEVLQGSLTNTLIPGFNLVGTKVPQAGGVQTVHNVSPAFFDTVYRFDSSVQNYFPSESYFGSWSPSEPSINVAQGFWYYNASGANNNWVRNFSVPTP
jgi:hypothetical protein